MYSLKDSSNIAIFYTRVCTDHSDDGEPIESQIEKAKSYATSKGLVLEEIFVDDLPKDDFDIYSLYAIKDKALSKSQKFFPPKRLLMPELVPILSENSKQSSESSAFHKMIGYIHENPVNVLLISKIELLFVNIRDLLVFIDNELNPLGIDLQTLSGNLNIRPAEAKQLLTASI